MTTVASAQRKSVLPLSSQVSEARYCHLETRVAASGEIRVAVAGRERCDPDYTVARESFPCYALELVASGTGELVFDRQSYPLHAGVIFLYGPATRHRIINLSPRPMTKYFVDFWGSEALRMLKESDLVPGHVAQTLEVEKVSALFEQLIDEGAKNTKSSKRICAGYLRIIALKAAEAIQPVRAQEASLVSRFQQWQDFIRANCRRLRDLGDISRELGVSPNYLCRVFKQFGQTSPCKFLTRWKMNYAADLLASARQPVKNVALDVGYPDQAHFSRLFKSYLGCAPVHFVQRHLQMRGDA